MLRLIMGTDWTANRDRILLEIAEDVRQRKENRILIVPELISHETERRLCTSAGDTASRYAEVVSFTRLVNRVTDYMNRHVLDCLDNGGRVVAMAAAARQLSSKLKAYAAVETKPEFLTALIDAVDEFKRCCITSEDLLAAAQMSDGALAQKLEELSLLMEAYDALCLRGKRDPRDQMTYLLELLKEGEYAQNHVFYIDGFPDYTRQNLAVLEHLIQYSPCVTVSVNCDTPGSGLLAFEKAGITAQELIRCANRAGVEVAYEYVSVPVTPLKTVCKSLFQGSISQGEGTHVLHAFKAASAYQAVQHAAKTVSDYVRRGCRYRDITVVCTDMGLYLPMMNLVFSRCGIPLYQAGTEDILRRSTIATVLNAVDAAISGFEQRETLRFLRCALSPLNPDECDVVENYIITWAIRGNKWLQEWTWHPEGLSGQWDEGSYEQLKLINEYRVKAVEPLSKLQTQFLNAQNLQEQVLAVYAFLENISLADRLSAMAENMDELGDNREAQVLNQLWEIIVSALEQLHDVLGKTCWEPEHFARLLRLLLSQYDVGTIPPVLDAVQMGPVTAMRCHQQKHLIILGAEEGKLPGYSGSSGILTDSERVELREMGVPLTGGALEGIQAEFSEIYGVFCGAEESIQVYSCSEQPSFVFRRLADMAGRVEEAICESGLAFADTLETGAYLAAHNDRKAAEALDVMEEYTAICQKRDYSIGDLESETVKSLYGTTLNLSASQIDRQAECRMSYFLQYGLRLKERKEAEIDPAEFGTYVHAVLENTARCIRDMGGFSNVTLEETLEIAHRYSEEYAAERFSQIESERITYLFRRNMQELDAIIQELWLELKDALFAPADFEVKFGGEDALPPIAIPNPSMNALLRGFVDRVDTWNTAGSTYYRIVDYKTGRKDFDYCDVFNGVGLQMLLYLFALRDSGSEMLGSRPVPAGVQYFPARAPYIASEGKLSEEEAERERLSQWKRKGLLLENKDVLQAMEPGEKPARMDYTVRKDGSLTGDLADSDQFRALEAHVFQSLAGMVQQIASGNVEPNPYTRGSSHNACAFCPYGPICHESEVSGRRNYKAMTANDFWAELGKEHGNGR